MTDVVTDLRTARVLVQTSTGETVQLVLAPATQCMITDLLTRLVANDGVATVQPGNLAYQSPDKSIVVKPGVPMDTAAVLVSRFAAYAAAHADERSFVGVRNGIAYKSSDDRFYYVYQTAN